MSKLTTKELVTGMIGCINIIPLFAYAALYSVKQRPAAGIVTFICIVIFLITAKSVARMFTASDPDSTSQD